ncbi:hypothetical protein GCM10027258_62420 [Amycolatopsis stemonae]
MSKQVPSLGRLVLVPMAPVRNNGSHLAPAVIVRVFNETTVNVRVLADSSESPEWRTSCVLVDEPPAEWDPNRQNVWAWPPRV